MNLPFPSSGRPALPQRGASLLWLRLPPLLLILAGTLLCAAAGAQQAGGATGRAQRLAFALYYYGFQGNQRKSAPTIGIRTGTGASLMRDHPWTGTGPWVSYDRAAWHRENVENLAAAGIDVLLPVFDRKAGAEDYSRKGLGLLVQALKELDADEGESRAGRRFFPRLALALAAPATGATPESIYEGIRAGYTQIPAPYRALIYPSSAPGSPAAEPGCLVRLLGGSEGMLPPAAARRVRDWFRRDFGVRLLLTGEPGTGAFDAEIPYPAAEGPVATSGSAWPRVAAFGPGWDPVSGGEMTPRENGRRLIEQMRAAIEAQPDWLFIDSWNGYGQGSEIAPTLEHGLLYRDLLRAGILQFKQVQEYAAVIMAASAPRQIVPEQIYQVEVALQNSGQGNWSPDNIVSLGYRWWRGGRPVTEILAPVGMERHPAGETRSYLIGVASPLGERGPLPPGDYDLEFLVTRGGKEGVQPFFHFVSHPVRLPVGVRAGLPPHAGLAASNFNLLVERGQTYPTRLLLRNEGSEAWKSGQASVGYRWKRVIPGGAAEPVKEETAAPAVFTLVEEDLLPGDVLDLQISVAVSGGDKPLPTWSPLDPWVYQIEWLFKAGSGESKELPIASETVQVIDRDPAPRFLGSSLPHQLVAGRTESITVGLRNTGPHAWKAGRDRVVVHWYYLDGVEAIYKDTSAPIDRDVPAFSGASVPVRERGTVGRLRREQRRKAEREGKPAAPPEMPITLDLVLRDIQVKAPPYFGPMYCVFDFEMDGLLASTAAGCRSREQYVVPVNIFSPTFTPLSLDAHFNIDGISDEVSRTDGNLDGRGNSLPGELLPPYTPPPPGQIGVPQPLVYPSGLWSRALNTLEGSRVCFTFPPHSAGRPNLIACAGQRILFAPALRTGVYLMAAATEEDVAGEFILYYTDGSSEKRSIAFSHWNSPPQHQEPIAFETSHRHTAAGDDPSMRCYLFEYRLAAEPLKHLVAVELPRQGAIKVAAVTLASGGLAAAR